MSIFKSTLKAYLRRQINTRQALLASDNRPSYFSKYVSSRVPWARMVSLVDIYDEKKKDYTNDLAKQYVLYAGISEAEVSDSTVKYNLRGGFKNGSYFNNLVNGERFGYRPMPGIEQVSVRSLSAYGSLREATVSFYVWDKEQLSILEKLYMRPGYYVFLEWGWSMYLDTNPKGKDIENEDKDDGIQFLKETADLTRTDLLKNLDTTGINPFLENKSEEEYYTLLEKNRKTFSGNYDGMLGIVRNFNWEYLPNGGYMCRSVIISVGDVIDSLKISSAQNRSNQTENETQNLGNVQYTPTLIELLIDNLNTSDKNNDIKKLFKDQLEKDKIKNPELKEVQSEILRIQESDPNGYIQFAYFVYILSITTNLFTATEKPLLKIEIPVYSKKNIGNGLCLGSLDSVSVDPTRCLIKNTKATLVTGLSTGFDVPSSDNNNAFKEYLYDDTSLGVIGNIYFRLDYLKQEYTNILGEQKNEVYLGNYLRQILNTANGVMGNINNFQIYAIDNVISIVDGNYTEVPSNTKKEKKFLLNLAGDDTIVRNSFIESKIFPSQATMIGIAAQDRENVAAVNSSTTAQFNKGLRNRIRKESIEFSNLGATSIADKDKKLQEEKNEIISTLILLRNYLTDIINNKFNAPPNNVPSMASALNTFLLKVNKDANYRAVIPISLEVDIDGTGGFTIGEIFRVNSDILPIGYNEKNIGFIVTGISNEIKRNDWITKINTQICLLDQDKNVTAEVALRKILQSDIDQYKLDRRNIAYDAILMYNLLAAYVAEYVRGQYREENNILHSNLLLRGQFRSLFTAPAPSVNARTKIVFTPVSLNLYSYKNSAFKIIENQNTGKDVPNRMIKFLSDLGTSAASVISEDLSTPTSGYGYPIGTILNHIFYQPNNSQYDKSISPDSEIGIFLYNTIGNELAYFYNFTENNIRSLDENGEINYINDKVVFNRDNASADKQFKVQNPGDVYEVQGFLGVESGVRVASVVESDRFSRNQTYNNRRSVEFLRNQVYKSDSYNKMEPTIRGYFDTEFESVLGNLEKTGKAAFRLLHTNTYDEKSATVIQPVYIGGPNGAFSLGFDKKFEMAIVETAEQREVRLYNEKVRSEILPSLSEKQRLEAPR